MVQRLKYLLATYCATIVLMALQKVIFLITYFSQASNFSITEWFKIFSNGIILDISTAGYITAIPLLLLITSVWLPLSCRVWRIIFMTYYSAIAVAASAIMAGDLGLYQYWGFRVDSSVLFYLQTPKEAMASVTLGDVALATVAFSVMCSAMIFTNLRCAKLVTFERLRPLMSLASTLVLALCGGVMFVGIRGGVTTSVANLSKVYFSNEPFLNHAAVNPQFSLLSTLGEEDDFVDKYLFFSDDELAANLAKFQTPPSGETPQILNTERPNILFIICESFSESIYNLQIGDEWVMPRLRKIAAEGLYFPNAIANSFRTDRGVTSALYGFPAQPRTSIMKYPAKSRKLPSLGTTLQKEGYSTEFIYGGDLNFTDMASMLYSTGWQSLVWQKDLRFKGASTGKWGYDDGVMSKYLVERIESQSATSQPFITTWLTLSSHEPFEVPYSKFDDLMLNSMAFSDEAVGDVVDGLRNTPAWDNLLIIIVADHAYKYPYGVEYNALQRHRIPIIWSGGALSEAMVVDKYVAQMDIIATLLAQMSISADEFEFSRNVMDSNFEGRGYYAFPDGFGVVTSQGAIVYDNTSNSIISQQGDITDLESMGKGILQRTMEVLGEY